MAGPLKITVNKPAPPPPPPVPVVTPPGLKEIATLEVGLSLFTNWTTVRVEQRVTEWFPTFQFECSEESPIPLIYDALQFVPGDVVRVFLGGIQVVFGYIQERHVAFDEKNHAIRLVGTGDTYDLYNSSVPLASLDGHDGEDWMTLARRLASHLNIGILAKGSVDGKPFKDIQIQPGDTIKDTLERYARMRDIVIGSNANGGLLAIGEHAANPSGEIVEGYNILRANCAVRDANIYKRIFAVGQASGGDQANGDQQNQQIAEQAGTSSRNRHLVVVADISDDQHGVERRALMEKVFTEGSKIEAQITVQGWFKDNNESADLWKAGEYYTITSASLIMPGTVLGCSGCVYEQSDAGTTTTMTLVDPLHMNGKFNYKSAAEALANQEREHADAAAAAAAEEAALKAAQQQQGGG